MILRFSLLHLSRTSQQAGWLGRWQAPGCATSLSCACGVACPVEMMYGVRWPTGAGITGSCLGGGGYEQESSLWGGASLLAPQKNMGHAMPCLAHLRIASSLFWEPQQKKCNNVCDKVWRCKLSEGRRGEGTSTCRAESDQLPFLGWAASSCVSGVPLYGCVRVVLSKDTLAFQ